MGGVPFSWTTRVEALSLEAAWGGKDTLCRAFLSAVLGPLPQHSPGHSLIMQMDRQGVEPRNLYFKMLLGDSDGRV